MSGGVIRAGGKIVLAGGNTAGVIFQSGAYEVVGAGVAMVL
jgi:hypothetical protein